MKKALIIGGGMAGCAASDQISKMEGWDVTLVEIAPQLGAGVRTNFYGGHPYTFGPRHFLTKNEDVYNYLDSVVPLRSCNEHEFITYVEQDSNFYTYPIHRDDVPRMPDRDQIEKELGALKGIEAAQNFEEYWIQSIGQSLYDKFIDKYSRKMWRLDDNKKIDSFNWSPKGVPLKEGPRAGWDTALSAFPLANDGYNAFFDKTTKDTKVLLSTKIEKFDIPNKTVYIEGQKMEFDVIVNTVSPDILFDNCYGELAFAGRDFIKIVLPIEHAFPKNTYFVYYAGDEPFTRAVEYKKFYRYESEHTMIGLEIPSANGRHYPMPFNSELAKAEKYWAEMPEGVFSIGRAGSFRYVIDIDDGLEQALLLPDLIKQGGRGHPVPIFGSKKDWHPLTGAGKET